MISDDDIINAVENIGYGASLKSSDTPKTSEKKNEDTLEDETKHRLKVSFAFLIPLMYLAMGPMVGLPVFDFITGPEGALNNAFLQFLLSIPVIFVNRKFFISGFKGLVIRLLTWIP